MSTQDEQFTSDGNRHQIPNKRSSTALTLKDDRLGHDSSRLDHPAIQAKTPADEDDDMLIVDWEGPDDPENPKKQVLEDRISQYSSSHECFAAGLNVGSGWRHSLSHLLLSSVQYHPQWSHQRPTLLHRNSISRAPS